MSSRCFGLKAFYLLPLALLVAACANDAPSIDDLEEDSYPLVEQVLTEDENVTSIRRPRMARRRSIARNTTWMSSSTSTALTTTSTR